ncbi:hypothetical protein A6U85_07300 [Agrobacterium sp. 13-626]|uniref:Uncharacterized protein n=2 Tax=Rhizobium rhizogenes TaxID=359 RepID=B9JLL5_RHIR8|nr:hypothetical protein Arad_9779 [Rhizobium rhizogenes K84]KAA6488929.1 hypothetical protein DXT98_11205 [Agrobacterium sp. ICMP 7243]KEA08514.1 hypothetical protein CN09_22850 [Rhizobium rhizogenes]OCJ01467.1 hypothetical protein A6U85_07300 [Agrobacterium sp. 13-626]OCJ16089.1 hypothetical protein A6U88_16630 [Agrobacterium sp. B131/95]OCJ19179.1 hypothetical protein A6U89_14390 [Agrobacterium sp. B133/95]GAJ96828.1 hypothetical protein RRH01S_26_00240 [Rhizobium rhizogenes NBRC 13257]
MTECDRRIFVGQPLKPKYVHSLSKEKTGLSETSQPHSLRSPDLIDGLEALVIGEEQACYGDVARNPDGGDWQ